MSDAIDAVLRLVHKELEALHHRIKVLEAAAQQRDDPPQEAGQKLREQGTPTARSSDQEHEHPLIVANRLWVDGTPTPSPAKGQAPGEGQPER